MFFTNKEIRSIRSALYLAIDYEETFIDANLNVIGKPDMDMKSAAKNSRKKIISFKKLLNKIEQPAKTAEKGE